MRSSTSRDPESSRGAAGGVAFHQLLRSDAEVHLFTAVGSGDAGGFVQRELDRSCAHVHAARRDEPHTRVLVLLTPDGERTLVVVGEPNHPTLADRLPWELLSTCDAAYFTAQDPELLRVARAAKRIVVTARCREAIVRSGVHVDVVVGSAVDAREKATLGDFPVPPGALVLTEGAKGGAIVTRSGERRFAAVPARGSTYGAGDAFAAALTYFVGAGLDVADACARAARYGAAVVGTPDPIQGILRLVSPTS